MDIREVARAARSSRDDPAVSPSLRARHRRRTEAVYAPKQGVDARDLAQTGWGVVFSAGADPAIRRALKPLLDHRRADAAAIAEHRYREFIGADGYHPGESKQEFLSRHGAGPGPIDPDVVPYYLLLVGGPDEIPFEVGYQLDVQHAVGRLAFDDLPSYTRYAENVLAAESRAASNNAVKITFFAARNTGDPATRLAADHLVEPLTTQLGADARRWNTRSIIGQDASKECLEDVLASSPPDLLFTATHGLGLPAGHVQQRMVQGGLVCQDWPGPGQGRLERGYWFDARDVPNGDLTGLIAFIFACFGAGTPAHDDFDRSNVPPRTLAPTPFVAALPKAMLGREGGALAVAGHVDRALGYSFVWPGAGRQTEVYRSTLAEIGAGQPVGSALEYLGDRYAELATDLGLMLEEIRLGRRADDEMLAGLWTAHADARGFVLLGDPAARLVTPSAQSAHTANRSAPVFARPVAARTSTGMADTEAPTRAGEMQLSALHPVRHDPVEVATYVTDDPAGVAFDPATGCISGARLHLFSSVDLDGTAAHVTTTSAPDVETNHAVTEIHARMIQVSITARRARGDPGGAP